VKYEGGVGENCSTRASQKHTAKEQASVLYKFWARRCKVFYAVASALLTTHIAAGDKTRCEISPKTVYDEFYYARRDFSLFICSTTYSSHKYYIVSIKVKSIRFNFFSLSPAKKESSAMGAEN
jgi:hypothetical protein